MTTIINEIQHFSIGDGEGIRTTVFVKGCNLHCAWCHNIEMISSEPVIIRYKTNSTVSQKLCGVEMTIDSIMREILEDKAFYDKSGGGVTISGGEPLLQADFVTALVCACMQHGINTAIDTAGSVPNQSFVRVLPYTDTFLYDIKGASQAEYTDKCGGDFDLIIHNLRFLVTSGANVVVRIPVIPHHNDNDDFFKRVGALLQEIGVIRIDLLPFHNYGASKYKALGLTYAYANERTLTATDLYAYQQYLQKLDFQVQIV